MTHTEEKSYQEKLCLCSDVEFNKQKLQLTEQILHDTTYMRSKTAILIETE